MNANINTHIDTNTSTSLWVSYTHMHKQAHLYTKTQSNYCHSYIPSPLTDALNARAYPDMLMIGVQGQTPDESTTGRLGPWAGGFVQPSVTEQRSHFGLWCTLSAPLTLSLDFGNKSATDSVWDIITNKHAIAVNQVSPPACATHLLSRTSCPTLKQHSTSHSDPHTLTHSPAHNPTKTGLGGASWHHFQAE